MAPFWQRQPFLAGVIVLSISCVIAALIGYFGMIKQKEDLDFKWKQLCGQYRGRMNLVPNLVVCTRELIAKDRTVFERLASARRHFAKAHNSYEEAYARLQLDAALSDVIALAEVDAQISKRHSYGTILQQLKANEQQMRSLTDEYNLAVEKFNLQLQTLPYNAIAALFHISSVPYTLSNFY